jgi:Domain of unknown function (DUF4266)
MSCRALGLFLIIGGAVLTGGCASLGVKPWQRDLLSRQDMQLNGNAIDDAIDDHLYFSKEASSGGRSFAGGGCGCN